MVSCKFIFKIFRMAKINLPFEYDTLNTRNPDGVSIKERGCGHQDEKFKTQPQRTSFKPTNDLISNLGFQIGSDFKIDVSRTITCI